MLASLALITLLQAPTVGADSLALANVRLTHGLLGAARDKAEIRPGDSLILAFDIQGIASDDTGKASYTTSVDVKDTAGKTLFSQPPKKFQEFLPLGGGTAPAFAQIDLGPESPAGKYTMVVTVLDNTNQQKAVTQKDFTVLAKAFDIVRLTISGDADGLIPVGSFSVGQPFWVHASVVGFERAATGTKQPKVSIQLRVLDEGKKPIVAKPFAGIVEKDVPANATSLPIRFFVPLNKAGTFTVELSATDELKKTSQATFSFPLKVVPHQ
ncbi:MAG: hypothetical protein K8T89_07910 [Planctomycetes bacterium]|nr:hypothetical protein [Planctomycetota bacterium]